MHMSIPPLLSSDTPEEGIRPHQMVVSHLMWLLGIEFGTSGRAVSALNHWAISPAHIFYSLETAKKSFWGLHILICEMHMISFLRFFYENQIQQYPQNFL